MGCLPKLRTFIKFNHRSSTIASSDHTPDSTVSKQDDDCVKKYTWGDLCRITTNFSCLIGSGGFSTVYLGQLLPGLPFGAVKMIHPGSGHLKRILKNELDVLLQIRNKNIVKLLGYYNDDEDDHEGVNALVLEYVPNGSLQDNLHGDVESERKSNLSWQKRMAIAFQLAEALEYLHEKCTPQIVHGDIKASNILLDENLKCKLCDFGFAKMGFSSMVKPNSRGIRQVMMGSPGYTDPHYLRTGLASKKNDVYSYGVVVLELVTGRQAFCEEKGELLTSTMGPLIKDIGLECEAKKVGQLVDPKLGGGFDVKEARAMLSIATLCLDQSPLVRPSAAGILREIKENVSSISFLYSSPDAYKGSIDQ